MAIEGGISMNEIIKGLMKNYLRPPLIPVFRGYIRYFPVTAGKMTVWNAIGSYFQYAKFPFSTRTLFGGQFTGNTVDVIQRFIYYFGIWEPALTYWIRNRLKPGDVFVDVGANIGYFTVLASGLVLAVPVIFYSQTLLFEDQNEQWHPDIPVSNSQWRGPLRFAGIWSPSFVNADISENLMFVSEDLARVQFSFVGYRTQGQDKELIYYRNSLFEDGWRQLASTTRSLNQPNAFNIGEVTETMLLDESSGDTVLVWSWYELGSYASRSRLKIKLVGGLQALTGNSTGAFLALAGQCEGFTLERL